MSNLGGDFNYAAVRSQLNTSPALSLSLTTDVARDFGTKLSSRIPPPPGHRDSLNAWKDLGSYQISMQTEVAARVTRPQKPYPTKKKLNIVPENVGFKQQQQQVASYTKDHQTATGSKANLC